MEVVSCLVLLQSLSAEISVYTNICSLDLEDEVFWLLCYTGRLACEKVFWLLCYTGTTVTETTSLSVKSYNLLSFPVNLLLQTSESLRSYVRDAQCQKYLCSRKKTVFIHHSL